VKTGLGKAKSIDTPYLKIRKNCLEIENTTIQLSNISLFSTADITPNKFPKLSAVFILVGIFLLRDFFPFAIVPILLGGIWIYLWYSSVQEAKKLKRLTIVTNSGNAFPIVFDDREFLTKVVAVMTDIIRDPAHARDIIIDVHGNRFADNSDVIGKLIKK